MPSESTPSAQSASDWHPLGIPSAPLQSCEQDTQQLRPGSRTGSLRATTSHRVVDAVAVTSGRAASSRVRFVGTIRVHLRVAVLCEGRGHQCQEQPTPHHPGRHLRSQGGQVLEKQFRERLSPKRANSGKDPLYTGRCSIAASCGSCPCTTNNAPDSRARLQQHLGSGGEAVAGQATSAGPQQQIHRPHSCLRVEI